MSALHQVRAVSLTGFLEVAAIVGLDPYAMLRGAGISPASLEDPEFRLPAAAVTQLLETSAQVSGCASLGMLMAECRTFESLGPLALLLQHLGSSREVIEHVSRHRRQLNDIVDMTITEAGDQSFIEIGVLPQFVGPQVIDLTIAMTQLATAGASRRHWKPTAVHFRHSAPDDLTIFSRFFSAPVRFDSTFDGFEYETRELDWRWPWESRQMAQNAARLLQQADPRDETFPASEQVVRTIALLLPSARASLEQVAAALGSSPRAIQRLLEKEGSTFGGLLTKTRRELATRYLSNPAQNISSVAEWTGYSSNSSFTRWFAAEFGVSPTEWRERLPAASAA